MTKENILKDYKHFCILAKGDFNERTFDFELKAENPDDAGSTHVGKMSQQRIDLIKSDAKRHKEDMEKKYPELCKPKVKELDNVAEDDPMEEPEHKEQRDSKKSNSKRRK